MDREVVQHFGVRQVSVIFLMTNSQTSPSNLATFQCIYVLEFYVTFLEKTLTVGSLQ